MQVHKRTKKTMHTEILSDRKADIQKENQIYRIIYIEIESKIRGTVGCPLCCEVGSPVGVVVG